MLLVKVVDHSLRSQEENAAEVVGVLPYIYISTY